MSDRSHGSSELTRCHQLPCVLGDCFFPGLDSIPAELDVQFYSALLSLQSKLNSDAIDWDSIYSWNIDQNLGTITLTFEDESVALTARIQILGSFDGSTFMWACQNTSVNEELKQDSKRLRKFGRSQGWTFFNREQFPATSRDGYAIMAFAAQTLQAPSAYAGQTGERVVYFTLYDLESAPRQKTIHLMNPKNRRYSTRSIP